jgi:hypothetical protein
MPFLPNRFLLCAALLCCLSILARAEDGPLPRRDLTVELRMVAEGLDDGAVHYGVGDEDRRAWEPHMVQVRNGEKALLRMSVATPLQWTQSVSAQSAAAYSGATSGTPVTNNSASTATGVSNALVWFDAGQSMSVQPTWPGGKRPVVLVLEVQSTGIESTVGAALPKQSRGSVSTTVTVPLQQWQTIAATGKPVRPGVYSSESGEARRRLLQVRVSAP